MTRRSVANCELLCKFEGCDKKHHARGWCQRHYERAKALRLHSPLREPTWTDELVEQLAALFSAGMPASEIGRRMGLTKGSIIGRLYRNGMRPPPQSPVSPAEALANKAKDRRWLKMMSQREDDVVTSEERLNALLNTFPPPRCCRFPSGHVGEPGFSFCGRATDQIEHPYCATHMRLAILKVINPPAVVADDPHILSTMPG